jgi:hypothetical protein
MLQINSQTAECLKMNSQYNGLQRREHATLIHCFDRSLDGARADIQVPESDFSHDFVAGHERDAAGIDARDSRLCAGHGDRERLVWPGSELDPRRHAAATLSGITRSFAAAVE